MVKWLPDNPSDSGFQVKLIQPTGRLFGLTLRNVRLTDFDLSEGAYRHRIVTPPHSHEWGLLCAVLKGNYLERSGASRYRRGRATVFFHPPGEPHVSDFSGTAAAIFQIEIKPQRLALMDGAAGLFRRPIHCEGGAEFLLATKIYREFRWMDDASPIAIEGLTLELLAGIARGGRARLYHDSPPAWLRRAKDFLHDNFSENHTLDAIAAEVGRHPKYLAAEFRRCYRLTIGEYVRRLRVEHARRALAEGDLPLAEVALASGFHSQSHLSRTFKSLTGFTPAQYRKKQKA